MSLNLGLESLGFDVAGDVSYESLMEDQVEILRDMNQADHMLFDLANTAKDVTNFNEIVTSLQNHASQECVDFASDLLGMHVSLEAEKIKVPGEKQGKVAGFFSKAWDKIVEWIKKAYNWCKKQLNKVLRKLDLVEQTAKNPEVTVHWSVKELDQLLKDPKVANGLSLIKKAEAKAQARYSKFAAKEASRRLRPGQSRMTADELAQVEKSYNLEELLKINLFTRKPKKIKIKIGTRNIKDTRMSSDTYGQKNISIDEAKEYMQLLTALLLTMYDYTREIVDNHEELEKNSHKNLVLLRAIVNRCQTISGYALADYNAIMKTTMGSASKIIGKYDSAVTKREDIKNELKDATKNM